MESIVVIVCLLVCCALAIWRVTVRRQKGSGDCAHCPWRGTDHCQRDGDSGPGWSDFAPDKKD